MSGSGGRRRRADILYTFDGGLMLLLTLLSVTATVIVGFLGARTAAGFARDLRGEIFRKVEHFSFAELDKFSTASLITRSTNDITQMQMVTVMGLRMMFYAPIIGIGGVIRATGKASSMWWIIAWPSPSFSPSSVRFSPSPSPSSRASRSSSTTQSRCQGEPFRHDGHSRLRHARNEKSALTRQTRI